MPVLLNIRTNHDHFIQKFIIKFIVLILMGPTLSASATSSTIFNTQILIVGKKQKPNVPAFSWGPC